MSFLDDLQGRLETDPQVKLGSLLRGLGLLTMEASLRPGMPRPGIASKIGLERKLPILRALELDRSVPALERSAITDDLLQDFLNRTTLVKAEKSDMGDQVKKVYMSGTPVRDYGDVYGWNEDSVIRLFDDFMDKDSKVREFFRRLHEVSPEVQQANVDFSFSGGAGSWFPSSLSSKIPLRSPPWSSISTASHELGGHAYVNKLSYNNALRHLSPIYTAFDEGVAEGVSHGVTGAPTKRVESWSLPNVRVGRGGVLVDVGEPTYKKLFEEGLKEGDDIVSRILRGKSFDPYEAQPRWNDILKKHEMPSIVDFNF